MKNRFSIQCFCFVWCLLSAMLVQAGFAMPTPLEKADFTRASQSEEMTAYMQAIANAESGIRLETLGKTVQGRNIVALVFAKEAPTQGVTNRLKVMIIGSQHGAAEPAGGEALLVIARDLLAGDLKPLRDSMDIILIPDANPDGRDLLRRSNANVININTDFVLMSQPESRVLSQALTRYQPDVILDSHESAVLKRQTLAKQGYLTDFYAQFDSANNPAIPTSTREYAFNKLLPELIGKVSDKGLPAHRYIGEITDIHQPITNGGLTLQNFRNMAGMHGALSFLVETRLDSRDDPHPTFRNIRERVGRQLICLRAFLDVVRENQGDILAHNQRARAEFGAAPVPLKARYVPDASHPEVAIALRRTDNKQLQTLIFKDHRKLESSDSIAMPRYLAVTDHEEVIKQFLDMHEVKFDVVATPTQVNATANRFTPPRTVKEGASLISSTNKTLPLKAGDILIDLSQPLGRMALLLLDPRSISNVFRYPAYAPMLVKGEEFFIYPVNAPLSQE